MIESDRAEALGALYAADVTELADIDTSGLTKRAAHLARGTHTHREDLDADLSEAATSWRVERMAVVDRNILRLASYELKYTDLSTAVVIDEAIRLAKEFSTADSSRFINGVLDAVARNVRDQTKPEQ